MRALHIQNTQNTLIKNITIVDSIISNNDLLYFSRVHNLQMSNTFIMNLTHSIINPIDIRVIKIDTL